MKRILTQIGVVILLAGGLIALPAGAQNISKIKDSARTAAAGISVSTVNGKTSIVYKGQEVWTGKTKNKVLGRTKVVNNTEYVAAFDGDKVLWENVPGAAKHLK